MKKTIIGVAAGCAGFIFGFAIFQMSSDILLTQRDPAALNGKVFQITNLSAEEIRSQIERKLVVAPTANGQKQVAFSGFSSAICKTYSTIEMELVAEGVSVAGEPPVLKISHPCEAGETTTTAADIASLNLPVDLLLKEKPINKEYRFDGFKTVMTLQNTADEWPHVWVVRKIEFKSATGTDVKGAHFGRAPASSEAPKPIILEF